MEKEHNETSEPTRSQLHERLTAVLDEGNTAEALFLISKNIGRQEHALFLKQQLAIALAKENHNEEANHLLHHVAGLATRLNRPLDAITSVLLLADWGNSIDDLIQELALRYAEGSVRLVVGTRPIPDNPPDEPPVVDLDDGDLDDVETLCNAAIEACGLHDLAEMEHPPEVGTSPIPLMSDLQEEDFCSIVRRLRTVTTETGEQLVSEGERLPGLWWLNRGELTVESETASGLTSDLPCLIGLESIFGERSTSTISCCGPCQLLFLPTEQLTKLMRKSPAIRQSVMNLSSRYEVHQAFSQSPLMQTIPTAEHDYLLTAMEGIRVRSGEVLVKQGNASPGVFILSWGSLSVSRETEGEEPIVSNIQPGGTVGLTSNPKEASEFTISATSNCRILYTSYDDLEALAETRPEIGSALKQLGISFS